MEWREIYMMKGVERGDDREDTNSKLFVYFTVRKF